MASTPVFVLINAIVYRDTIQFWRTATPKYGHAQDMDMRHRGEGQIWRDSPCCGCRLSINRFDFREGDILDIGRRDLFMVPI
jgi:hypothetical protein